MIASRVPWFADGAMSPETVVFLLSSALSAPEESHELRYFV
jgi:hypothetical protein